MAISAKLVLLIFCTVPIYCSQSESYPTVDLLNGKIRGRDHGHYISFESIPYAEPPIGKLRFEAPKPYTASWADTLDGTIPPVKCMQWDHTLLKEDLLDGKEDCLTVNVYTPAVGGNKSFPVLVLIHGGAFMFGTATESGHYNIMKNQNTVVVKMNYRLGPLGFLSTEDNVISGNFGLKDQLLALEWTKANVAAFNGNPESITVFGFSSGGASVHLHMLNKKLENIAKGAVSLSATSFCDWVIMRNPARRAVALAKHLNCPTKTSSAIKTCLKMKNAADIVCAVKKMQNIGYNPAVVFGPVIESKNVPHAFLSESPETIIKSGKSAQIPWLASYAEEDGGYNAAELMMKDANGVELIEILNERWNELAPVNLFFENSVAKNELDAYSNSLRQKYMGDKNFTAENYFLVQKMYTDILFVNGVKKAWKLHKKYTNSPVYAYVFDSPPPVGIGQIISNRSDISFGTVHGDDFFLIFNSPYPVSFSETQKEQSEKFIKMVEEFCTNTTVQFGDCKFMANNANTKGFYVVQIKPDSCETINFENIL